VVVIKFQASPLAQTAFECWQSLPWESVTLVVSRHALADSIGFVIRSSCSHPPFHVISLSRIRWKRSLQYLVGIMVVQRIWNRHVKKQRLYSKPDAFCNYPLRFNGTHGRPRRSESSTAPRLAGICYKAMQIKGDLLLQEPISWQNWKYEEHQTRKITTTALLLHSILFAQQ
jgi:hypothetical protein